MAGGVTDGIIGKHGFEKDPKLSFSGFVSNRTSLKFRLFGGGLKGFIS